MPLLRIIGDVHGQIEPDDVVSWRARGYLETIAKAPYSIQVGDMGDGQTYAQLTSLVDVERHRFFPGNHDHYDQLPPHCLGDFGAVTWGGVDFFFIRAPNRRIAKSSSAWGANWGRRFGSSKSN